MKPKKLIIHRPGRPPRVVETISLDELVRSEQAKLQRGDKPKKHRQKKNDAT